MEPKIAQIREDLDNLKTCMEAKNCEHPDEEASGRVLAAQTRSTKGEANNVFWAASMYLTATDRCGPQVIKVVYETLNNES